MHAYREHFIDFFKDENIRSDLRELFKPFLTTIYNEVHTYIILFCIYNILLFVIILAIFYILINHILVKKPVN
jgi:hypothetical protein